MIVPHLIEPINKFSSTLKYLTLIANNKSLSPSITNKSLKHLSFMLSNLK
jgi:hypothetical protein